MPAAACKRCSGADKSQAVKPGHWRGRRAAETQERARLRQAASPEGLYAGRLRWLWPHAPRGGESLRAQAERLSRIAVQGKAVERLQSKLRREKDFACKIEINRELRREQAVPKGQTD